MHSGRTEGARNLSQYGADARKANRDGIKIKVPRNHLAIQELCRCSLEIEKLASLRLCALGITLYQLVTLSM